jgi:hypothetical protein
VKAVATVKPMNTNRSLFMGVVSFGNSFGTITILFFVSSLGRRSVGKCKPKSLSHPRFALA